MNKIHVLYDVMNTMKAKEEVKGVLQVQVEKVVVTAAGNQMDAQTSQHDLKADAQLVLAWEDESDAS